MTNCLVTGGAGFIGSNLVDKLIQLGYNVTIIDNLSTGDLQNVNPQAKFKKIDVRENLRQIFEENFDYVFHLAAQANLRKSLENPIGDFDVNVKGSLNLFKYCLETKVKKVIFSSTGGAIYSSQAPIPCNEESTTNPLSPYGLAKKTTEEYLKFLKSCKGLNYVALRYGNVYGPRQNAKGEAGVISIFVNNALEQKPLKVFGDGDQTRDYVYVKDVVSANIRAMENDMKGTYNVSTGIETSVNDLIALIKKRKEDVKVEYQDSIKGELKRSCLDSQKLRATGWKSKYDLKEGFNETYEYFSKK